MRKVLIIALGVASLGALFGKGASAATACKTVCLERQQIPGSYAKCVRSKWVCTSGPVRAPGPVPPLQQQQKPKLKGQR